MSGMLGLAAGGCGGELISGWAALWLGSCGGGRAGLWQRLGVLGLVCGE